MWGGLRVGWLRAEEPVAARFARHKAPADLGTPVLDQAVAVRLLPRLAELEQTRAQSADRRLRHEVEVVAGRTHRSQWPPRLLHPSSLHLPPDVLTEAVHRLTRAWADFRRHGPVPEQAYPLA
ncbi:hypothetical protein [Streptomyces sp. NPDC020817]|uniref:hypothetical protein n=1 Tax=Streptomyces sp. NPDC020817 TaxID=3365095 RepID=UPI0037B30F3E